MKIGVVGCSGRMGRTVVQQLVECAGCELAGASERPGSPAVGMDAGVMAGLTPLGVTVANDPLAAFAEAQVVIDFTTPEATAHHARLARERGCALVVGTTGLTAATQAALDEAARTVPVVVAPNMSLGVNLLIGLVEKVASVLGPDFDIEITEMHHRNKLDAPSGTALGLGRAAAAGRAVALDEVAVRVRDGITGVRRPGDIGFSVLRGGDVVGEHTVIFAGEGERIELGHRATSRAIFARGALRAACWAVGKPAGRYGMADVLGLGSMR
jgi:4-hydroxy-tetrahydrodipicolinate reductase